MHNFSAHPRSGYREYCPRKPPREFLKNILKVIPLTNMPVHKFADVFKTGSDDILNNWAEETFS
jgi:hypothetical protein